MGPNPPNDPKAAHYSYATLQSDPKGQFTQLISHIRNAPEYPSHLDQVFQRNSDLERIHYIDIHFLNVIQLIPIFKKKDDSAAERAKSKGNQLFQNRKIPEAINFYNKCIVLASSSKVGKELACLSIANRSACSYHLGAYNDAISDIQLALALSYPMSKRFKIYCRLARCYTKLGEGMKAKATLQILRTMLDDHPNEPTYTTEVLAIQDELESRMSAKQSQSSPNERKDRLQLKKHHKSIRGFSDRITVDQSEESGRYVVAATDVDVGETLVVEDPCSSVIYPERNGVNCHCCLKRIQLATPCSNCSGVTFCSLGCQESGMRFHQYECRFHDVMTGFGCSQISRLALRLVTQRDFGYFMDLRGKLDTLHTIGGKDAYVQVYNLVHNKDRRWKEDVFARCLMAGVLMKILLASDYIPGHASKEQILFLGSLLIRHLEILQFNAHEVYEVMRGDKTSLKPSKNQAVGLAIYPSSSYFNHSCHGGVVRFFNGNQIVIKTLRPFRRGEEISENYGPTFYVKDRRDRQSELRARYWFECHCEACRQNWPLLSKLEKDPVVPNELTSAQTEMKCGNATKAANYLCNYLRKKAQFYIPPTENLIIAQDKLRTCFSNLGSLVFVEMRPKK